MSWKPDVTVAAIAEDAGRFLIVEERIGNRLVFNQPAGHLEANESLVEAAIRETLEETAWTFEPHSLVGVYLWKHPERPKTFLRVTFSGRVTHHDPARPLDRGIHRALWFSRDQLAARAPQLRSPMVLRCIDDYLKGRRFPLDVVDHVVEDMVDAGSSSLQSAVGSPQTD